MQTRDERFQLVVCGGGLSGLCTAVAAARGGVKTALIHDRPVLGGNASSEIRVTIHGCGQHHAYGREHGIISEILERERATNHETINENGWTNSVLDMVLYDLVQQEPLLTVLLNTTVTDVFAADGTLASDLVAERLPAVAATGYALRPACPIGRRLGGVMARVANAETIWRLHVDQVVDATGDGLIADLAGCGWRWGSEPFEETEEVHAPTAEAIALMQRDIAAMHADGEHFDGRVTMGNSIHIRARDIGRPAPYSPPSWAVQHRDASYFYDQGRHPHDPQGGFWWIEIGVPWNTIYDNETIRHQLTAHALGVWDWMKNHDPDMREVTATFALDWIGQVPGKRESRRIDGRYRLTEHDLQACRVFDDEIAYGGWFVDLHSPGGLLAGTSEPAAAEGHQHDSAYAAMSHVGPYGIPLRSLIAADMDNLAMVGRNLSATHAALGSVRVMGTCAVMGQGLGTALAEANRRQIDLAELVDHADAMTAVQQQLLRDGCFLPGVRHADVADLAPQATLSATSQRLVRAAEVSDAWADGGLGRGPTPGTAIPLDRIIGQLLAGDGGDLDQLAVCLDNHSTQAQPVRLRLRDVGQQWCYDVEAGPVLAETTVMVPTGTAHWVDWTTGLDGLPTRGWVRLEVGPDFAGHSDSETSLAWRVAGTLIPGHLAMGQISGDRMSRCLGGVTMAFKLKRGLAVFGPEQVVSGATRPQRGTERWSSDPAAPLPQALTLRWSTPITIGQIEVTFPGHCLRELHAEPPFFIDPQIPRAWIVEALQANGDWQQVVSVDGHTSRRWVHQLATPMPATSLRLVVQETNGDPAAQIAEVRVYTATASD